MNNSRYKIKLSYGEYADRYPVHVLKRIERPTTIIHDEEVPSIDERESGFAMASRGEFGTSVQDEYKRFVSKYPLSGALDAFASLLGDFADYHEHGYEFRESVIPASSFSRLIPVAPEKIPGTSDPEAMALHIKEVAYFLRADLVGICTLPRYAIYSHRRPDGEPISLHHSHAIAIVIDQDWRTSNASNGHDWISNSMSFLSYSHSAFIACILAEYIRRLGYPAWAHHAMNYQVVLPPILLWAGLGEMSRIGDIVINPFLGPRFKASVVTTELPLSSDKPIDFGLQDFCMKCKKCARECPANAISDGDRVMYHGYQRWPLDVKKCTIFRISNQKGAGCGTCIKVCPWNKPFTPFHRFINLTMRHIPFFRRFGIYGDDLLGYGKSHYEDKWWLDILQNSNKGS